MWLPLLAWLLLDGPALAAPPTMASTRMGRRVRVHPSRRPRLRSPRIPRARPLPSAEQRRRRILAELAHAEPRHRADAAWDAGRLRLRRAQPRLRALLRDSEATVRRSAAWALGELGLPENALALYDRIIREKSPTVLAELAIALGKLRYRTARPLLLGLTWKADGGLRAAGIAAVGHLGDPADAPYLLRFARHLDPVLRKAAAEALGRLGGRTARRALARLLEDPVPAVQVAALDAVARLADRSVAPQVVRLVGAGHGDVRRAAVVALRTLGSRANLPALTPRLTDERAEVAAEAALTVAHLGGSPPAHRLLALLGSRHNAVRRAAARAAGLGGVREAIPALETLLDHAHPGLRIAAIEALGRLTASQSLPRLLARLPEATGQERVALIDAIGALRAITSVAAVVPLLRHEDGRIRAAALRALAQMARLDPRPLRGLAPLVLPLLRPHHSAVLLRAAAEAFGALPGPRPRAGFVALLRLTFHGEPGVRGAAARALGGYGDRLAGPALIRLRRDGDPSVRLEASLALIRLGFPRRGRPLRVPVLPDCDRAGRGLHTRCLLIQALRRPTRRSVAEAAFQRDVQRGPNTGARAALVDWLAELPAPWRIPLLQAARQSPCYLHRAAARRALSIWLPPVRPAAAKSGPGPRDRPTAAAPPGGAAHGSPASNPFDAGPEGAGCGCGAPGRSETANVLFFLLNFVFFLRRRSRREYPPRPPTCPDRPVSNQMRRHPHGHSPGF